MKECFKAKECIWKKQGFVWFVYEGCFVRRATTKYTIEWWWAARTSLVHKPCTFGVKVSVVICFFNREHLTEKYIKRKQKDITNYKHNKQKQPITKNLYISNQKTLKLIIIKKCF